MNESTEEVSEDKLTQSQINEKGIERRYECLKDELMNIIKITLQIISISVHAFLPTLAA